MNDKIPMPDGASVRIIIDEIPVIIENMGFEIDKTSGAMSFYFDHKIDIEHENYQRFLANLSPEEIKKLRELLAITIEEMLGNNWQDIIGTWGGVDAK